MLVESLGRVALHPTHSHTMRIRSQQIAKTEVAVLQAVDAYSAPLVWSAPPTGPPAICSVPRTLHDPLHLRRLALKDNEEFLKVLAKRARLGVDGERRDNAGGLYVDV